MPEQTLRIAEIVGAAIVASQLGLIAWVRWSFERIAEKAAAHAEAKVLRALEDHREAEHAHPKMIEAWERRRDDRLHEILGTLTETVRITVLAAAKDALQGHNEDPRAHPAASEHVHSPIYARLDRVDREIGKIKLAHNVVAETGRHKPIREGDE